MPGSILTTWIILGIAGLFLSVFAFYFRRISTVGHLRFFRRFIAALWIFLIGFGILHTAGLLHHRQVTVWTCIPLGGHDRVHAFYVADQASDMLSEGMPMAGFPMAGSLFPFMAADSIDVPHYAAAYLERAGVDRWIGLRFVSGLDHASVYDMEVYRHNRPVSTLRDTLHFNDPRSFYHRLFLAAGIGNMPEPDTFPPVFGEHAQAYGRARTASLIQNQPGKADSLFRMLMKIYPDDPVIRTAFAGNALRMAADMEKKQGFADAIYWETAGQLQKLPAGTSRRAMRLKARWFIQQERWNEALPVLESALQAYPNDAGLLYLLSRLHESRIREVRTGSREKTLLRALHCFPGYVQARLALGDLYLFQKRWKAAENAFQAVLKLNPRSLTAMWKLGRLYKLQNRMQEAYSLFEKIIQTDPQNSEAYYNLGILYYQNDRKAESERFFRKAVSLDSHRESHYYLGLIHMEQGNTAEAVRHFRIRIAMSGGPEDTFADRAREHLQVLVNREETGSD